MKKWYLLLSFLFIWLLLGLIIFHQPPESIADQPSPDIATRIVSMSPDLTEILFSLALDEQVVGVTSDSDYPPAALTKPNVGSFWQPNVEAIIAAAPNLIVIPDIARQTNLAHRLQRMGSRVLTIRLESIADLYEAIAKIGAATDRQPHAELLVSEIHARLENFKIAASYRDKPRVLWVVQRTPLRVAGRDTFINELLEIAGAQNAVSDAPFKYPPLGAEQIYAGAPDVIIESAMGRTELEKVQQDAFKYWSRYENIPAVKNRRIYVIKDDTISRLGPRIVEGVEAIAACLAAAPEE